MASSSGIETVRSMFAKAAEANRAVLMPYLTAGLPDPTRSSDLFVAMADEGADAFEVGIPYSDPLMDGPTIHEAGLRALAAGTDLDAAFGIIDDVTTRTGKPVIVMTYANPVMRVGVDAFAKRVVDAGGSAIIVVDMPVDESAVVASEFRAHGLGTVLFAAPTTDKARLQRVAEQDPVFVYGVAELGVTGERTEASDHAAKLAARVRSVTTIPLVLGVGISTPDHAAAAATVADGVIVGSALVRLVLKAETPVAAAEALSSAVRDLAAAVRR